MKWQGCSYRLDVQVRLTMHATLQMSAGGPYSAPRSTSRDRYWRVWISSEKCLYWQRTETRSSATEVKTLADGLLCYPPRSSTDIKTYHPTGAAKVCDLHRDVLQCRRCPRVLFWKGGRHRHMLLELGIAHGCMTLGMCSGIDDLLVKLVVHVQPDALTWPFQRII